MKLLLTWLLLISSYTNAQTTIYIHDKHNKRYLAYKDSMKKCINDFAENKFITERLRIIKTEQEFQTIIMDSLGFLKYKQTKGKENRKEYFISKTLLQEDNINYTIIEHQIALFLPIVPKQTVIYKAQPIVKNLPVVTESWKNKTIEWYYNGIKDSFIQIATKVNKK